MASAAYLGMGLSRELLTYVALVAAASLSFYSFHRLYSLWGLLPQLPSERWRVVYGLQRWLVALVPLGFLAAAYAFAQLPWAWQWRTLVPGLVSALYALPVIRWRRLRDFGDTKVVQLAVGWVWMCSAVPVDAAGGELPWGFLAERFAFLVALTLPFDYRDAEQDAGEGVVTWPQRLGRRTTLLLSAGLLVASGLYYLPVLTSEAYATPRHWAGVGLATASAVCLLLLPWAYAKTPPHHLAYGFVLDGLLIWPLVVALVGLLA